MQFSSDELAKAVKIESKTFDFNQVLYNSLCKDYSELNEMTVESRRGLEIIASYYAIALLASSALPSTISSPI